ncbi:hypothetical protein [Streptomyces sp. NPDC002889]|uniref:hypothetical protein n=1 Tax=Streptomyces sp. NPDC002889 TaxID=3364669 RepID=UPI00368BC192
MRVVRHIFEPDLLVTYKGRTGVIEIDDPHDKGRRSDDASRERLLRNASIKHIDRIDVRDSTTKAEVEKFVETFLKHLTACAGSHGVGVPRRYIGGVNSATLSKVPFW